jgi:GT2 family glycosyltransferase
LSRRDTQRLHLPHKTQTEYAAQPLDAVDDHAPQRRIIMPSSDPSSLSVVFVTYNSEQTIGEALRSVDRHLPGAEIVVVDNGSTDETLQVVRESASVRVVEGHGNVGFGTGVNLGARAASGHLLIVLNPDAQIVQGNAELLCEVAHRSPFGMRGCLLRDKGCDRYLKYSEWGWRRELLWLIIRWFLIPREMAVRRPSSRRTHSRSWVSGAAFVVSRAEFLELGGFDEDIFLYFEDVDLSRRYRASGAGVGTTNAIVVTHTGQGSAQDGHERIQGWALLSFLEIVAKWNGERDGERAARATLRLLDAVSTTAQIIRALPVIGRRAVAQARRAAVVRSTFLSVPSTPLSARCYPRARAILAAGAPTSAGRSPGVT